MASSSSSSSAAAIAATTSTPSPSSPASVLFESSQVDELDGFDDQRVQQQHQGYSRSTGADDDEEEEDDEEGDALLDPDEYGHVWDQETFVLQIAWKDTWEYLWSDQAGLAGIADAVAARSSSSSSSSDGTDPVERLPV
ncbi:hypothetical protein DFQ27_005722 [Actinomortierella ambigua]|uniref:Uncharacterized protein n=1 Tax=Actinomortierella ambigua TaxID=1343610 RepID=A0A9P6UC62_9FUNG|nr:hypothetical protein DFQ27_005722 [Actinomortierella ambigua]